MFGGSGVAPLLQNAFLAGRLITLVVSRGYSLVSMWGLLMGFPLAEQAALGVQAWEKLGLEGELPESHGESSQDHRRRPCIGSQILTT